MFHQSPVDQFLSYYPLKQGLKHTITKVSATEMRFLSYYPLKQGLKLEAFPMAYSYIWFLSYYPLKQGLKLSIAGIGNVQEIYFYPTIH